MQNTTVHLGMVLILFILAIGFYLLTDTFPKQSILHRKHSYLTYAFALIFLGLQSAAAFLIYKAYQEDKLVHLSVTNETYTKNFQAIQDKYQILAANTLNLVVFKPEVISLMEQAYAAPEKKAQARQKFGTKSSE